MTSDEVKKPFGHQIVCIILVCFTLVLSGDQGIIPRIFVFFSLQTLVLCSTVQYLFQTLNRRHSVVNCRAGRTCLLRSARHTADTCWKVTVIIRQTQVPMFYKFQISAPGQQVHLSEIFWQK